MLIIRNFLRQPKKIRSYAKYVQQGKIIKIDDIKIFWGQEAFILIDGRKTRSFETMYEVADYIDGKRMLRDEGKIEGNT